MRFSFEEAEIMNSYLEEQPAPDTKEDFIKTLRNTIEHSEDPELTEICDNIIIKLRELDEERFKKLVSELPVEHLSNY